MHKRRIAIFSDAHSLLEPTRAILEDIKNKGITEIYSLGDNIGVGPNPNEVIELLKEYNVQSIAGNSEEYVTLGIEPFSSYFTSLKEQSQLWTLSQLTEEQIKLIKIFPKYIELVLGGKKIALCHFANDVRIDFGIRSTWTYQSNFDFMNTGHQNNLNAANQFNYTNSKQQIEEIEYMINRYGKASPYVKGYLSAKQEPLFAGKKVAYYDAIVQGHVHWKLYEETPSTKFYSIRAVGMAYRQDPLDTASYIILEEQENGFSVEEVLVKYDREQMIDCVLSSDLPDKNSICKFISLNKRK